MKFIELFAGIGGFRLGLEALGHECVFASEIDKYAQQTYEANFGEKPHGDITQISADDIPDHDILTAGFPCQAFSVAGHRKGFEDTRGTLFFEIARILKAKKPQWFILENVKGLLSHNAGETFKVIIQTLEQLGYALDWRVLNSKDYGVPQNRERIFIIGNRDGDLFWKFNWPEKCPDGRVLADILEDRVEQKYFVSDTRLDKIKDKYDKKIRTSCLIEDKEGNSRCLSASQEDLSIHLIPEKYTLTKKQVKKAREVKSHPNKWGKVDVPDDVSKPSRCLPTTESPTSFDILLVPRLKKIGSVGKDGQGNRVYDPEGLSATLSSQGGGRGAKKKVLKDGRTWSEGAIPFPDKKDKPSRTIITGQDQNNKATMFIQDKKVARTIRSSGRNSLTEKHNHDIYKTQDGIRRLTPRECARLQGFPDDFKIEVSDNQAYKQFGNAVSVPVITAIGTGFNLDKTQAVC